MIITQWEMRKNIVEAYRFYRDNPINTYLFFQVVMQ